MSSGRLRALKQRVSRRDNGCCYLCGGEPTPDDPMELEHLTPVADGGALDDLDNLGLAHRSCHDAKTRRENAGRSRARPRRRRR